MTTAATNREIIADLNRVKALFQLRAITAALGLTDQPAEQPAPRAQQGQSDQSHTGGE